MRKTFENGIEYWKTLFKEDSIIEINDRVYGGLNEIKNYFESLKNTFRRIQFDIIGDQLTTLSESSQLSLQTLTNNEYQLNKHNYPQYIYSKTQNHRILSLTLYATYVPKGSFGCPAMMRFLSIFWYAENEHKIIKWLMTSSTSLLEFEEQLACNWIVPAKQLKSRLQSLMAGIYRDFDVKSMIHEFYDKNAEMFIDENHVVGTENIIKWYETWNLFGVSTVLNNIDEIDIIGNTVLTRIVTIISHTSGICSNTHLWYGLFRFNGHSKIVHEQRFYNHNELNVTMQILANCGDMSPQKVEL